ncbi:hypothetical protein [Marinobacterium sedimentorum]|uniref:hypothetical protein n=1 Tax=Marinobacterium sedimentorum TaxID=2927804 RepID=UPI0020C5CBAC|nr:hypothetical protein [Marinobacterium sedimentorum]MCP8690450.1 hypothetical protein [Marinobacterium sedimentorum]
MMRPAVLARHATAAVLLLVQIPIASAATLPLGTRTIYLLDNQGSEYVIGRIELQQQAASDLVTYQLDMDKRRFADHFLSMKEMKCLEGPEHMCFLPYPYDNPHTLSETDLRWLEHDLLFMFKPPSQFGANLWNGVYYQMTVTDGAIEGEARAVDLNQLAAPPDNPAIPPFGIHDINETELEQRWLPRLIIR